MIASIFSDSGELGSLSLAVAALTRGMVTEWFDIGGTEVSSDNLMNEGLGEIGSERRFLLLCLDLALILSAIRSKPSNPLPNLHVPDFGCWDVEGGNRKSFGLILL